MAAKRNGLTYAIAVVVTSGFQVILVTFAIIVLSYSIFGIIIINGIRLRLIHRFEGSREKGN